MISADVPRDMTPVLYQKFGYSGGDPIKAKQMAPAKKRQDAHTAFLNMHSFRKQDKELDSNEVLTEIISNMEIEHLNTRFLAAAELLIRHHNITDPSKITADDLREWLQADQLWSELVKTMPKTPIPSLEAQMQDIYRYIVRILNYRK